MSIHKRRYGPMNLRSPTKEDLVSSGLRVTRLRKPVPELFDRIIYALRFPPKRGRQYMYERYIQTIELFMDYFNQATKQSQWQIAAQLVDIHLAGKLLYMESHEAQFHGYHNFKYTWLSNLLFAMRSYVINRKYLLGEIPTNQTVQSWSAQYVPFPKPLDMPAVEALADHLYDLIIPRVEYIAMRSE